MVFNKNIMLKVFIFLKLFLLLGGCTYQYTNDHNVNIEDIKKIKLNVKSFVINKDSLDIITTDNLLQNDINQKIINQLEAWTFQKFSIKGIFRPSNCFFNSRYLSRLFSDKKLNNFGALSRIFFV